MLVETHIFFISSLYTFTNEIAPKLSNNMREKNYAGVTYGLISDHNEPDAKTT
jgi:hypothetical protein